MIQESKILELLGAGVQQYPCARGRMGFFAPETDLSAYEALMAELKQNGARELFARTVGDSLLSLYGKDGRYVHLSYHHKNRGIRVIATAEEELFEGMGGLTATGEPELWLMNMAYHVQTHRDNGQGMILKLADGSFVLWDGGYPDDMPGLLSFLEANTPAGQKPVIATWILTHSHGDHYWGFESLFKTGALDRIDLRSVLACVPTEGQFQEGRRPEPFFPTRLEGLLFEHGIRLITPLAGQVLSYPGVDVEVMQTIEHVYPRRIFDDNEASTVVFLKLHGGKTVLVPGDCQTNGLDALTDAYGSYLKCDVLQIPHHGCSGATKACFDCTDPEEVIFCTAEDKYLERITTDLAWNHYLLNHLHVRRAYYADHRYQRIV